MSTDLKKSAVWFDSHAHLHDEAYEQDLPQVIKRARENRVNDVLLASTSFSDSKKALAVAGTDDIFVVACGCHPHEAKDFALNSFADWQRLFKQNPEGKIVAVGEIGLDYHYDFSPRSVQKEVFKQQLEWAFAMSLPVVIHNREATSDCLEILKEQAARGRLRKDPGVFHCFSGSVETASIVLAMGFYLGFDGPVTFKNAKKVVAVVESCPLDRMLLETDSPYLTPVPYRGRRNEPAYLPLVGEKIAQIKGTTVENVAFATTNNARRLFRPDLPNSG